MLIHIRYQEKNQLCDVILAEVKLPYLVPGGLEVPDIKQQGRGMMDLTLKNISDQFFARFLFFKKLSCFIFWPTHCKYQLCLEKNLFCRLFSSKNSNSDFFFKAYISFFDIYFSSSSLSCSSQFHYQKNHIFFLLFPKVSASLDTSL